MKKLLIALCAAASLAAFAETETPAAEAGTPPPPPQQEQQAGRPQRGPRQQPTRLVINEKTTAADIEAFKAEAVKKIDEAQAKYAAQAEGEKKPVSVILFVNEGMGMGPRGQRGPGGQRPDGQRGPRPDGNGPQQPPSDGQTPPAPPAEAPAEAPAAE